MPPKEAALSVKRPGADRSGTSKLPRPLQFLLVVILSFTATLGLYSACNIFTKFELSGVSRRVNDPLEALIFPAWRIIELGVGWYARYDGECTSTAQKLFDSNKLRTNCHFLQI